ncbi:MAG: nad+ synthetase [Candidatus Aminicenantes bacterium]|nr:nad+ synthetase [Candidatus Aminicenantes bacterium]
MAKKPPERRTPPQRLARPGYCWYKGKKGAMKITMAQLNPVVGDLAGNGSAAASTFEAAAKAGSDLVVFPELFLTGYPPWDLLERPWFIEKTGAAVDLLVRRTEAHPGTGLLFGAPRRAEVPEGKPLHNSAILAQGGRILLEQHKSLLPTYDVFDETRYFAPAPDIRTVAFKGEVLGITICEDAWNDAGQWPQGRLYGRDPVSILAGRGATILINISASPFHAGKEEIRYGLIRGHARRHGRPFVFVNQVGANDELVFDGRSFAFDGRGDPLAVGAAFGEDVRTVDMDARGTPGLFVPLDRIGSVYEALVLGLRDYMRKCGFARAVVGLSGGIDSAVTCALAAAAVGPENVLAVTMPMPFSSAGSVGDSIALAARLGLRCVTLPIGPLYDAYLAALAPQMAGRAADTTEENLQARIRGNILMAFSNKFGHLVLSTGNKSELAVGYCTLYGDMSGGLAILSDVPKTMVYELAAHINRAGEVIPRAVIDKPPSAELKPGQVDADTLPPYPVLDDILREYVEELRSVDEIIALGRAPETVRRVAAMVDRNEYKRAQAAPGLKVTTKAFGVGRRMPIAAKVSG